VVQLGCRWSTQVAKGSHQLSLCSLAQGSDGHRAKRTNGRTHLFDVDVAAIAQFEVGLDLRSHLWVELVLEVIRDKLGSPDS
jgi:hypothetical protein